MYPRVILCLVLLFCSVSGVWAAMPDATTSNAISLDRVIGQSGPSSIAPAEVTFEIRATVGPSSDGIIGLSNGFRIYSPDGATWGIPVADTIADFGDYFSGYLGVDAITYYSADGIDADTIRFLGLDATPPFMGGWPSGYDRVSFSITIHPEVADVGKTICLDSALNWEWATASATVYPQWSGPHCFTIEEGTLDSDGDGVPDWDDNCPLTYNPTQLDSDLDGMGDACDDCPDDPDNDADADGICGPDDNCPAVYNPGQDDDDLDGAGDACDNCLGLANADQSDADLDNLGDLCDPVTVGFEADVLEGPPPLTVSFTDNSFGLNLITEWLWNFGDNQTSTDQNPFHEYLEDGVYDVSLMASDGVSADTLVQQAMIEVASLPFNIADFASDDVWQIKAVDLDHDNNTDLIWTHGLSSGLQLAYGDGQGLFDYFPSYHPTLGFMGAIAFGFLNSDGLIDVLVRDRQNLNVLLNDGDRMHSVSSYTLPTPSEQSAIAVGYFNDDQFLDVVTDAGSFVGDGTGNLTPGLSVPWFAGVDVADFNGDGVDDLVTAEVDEIAIHTNDGSGSFTKTGSVPTPYWTYEVSSAQGVADFDHDGDVDYAAASYSAVTVVLGDGSGGVDNSYVIEIDGVSHNLIVTDANRDHELDIVLSNTVMQRIEFYLGLGDGTFADPVIVSWGVAEGYIPIALASGDFDRDGNPDFVTGDFAGAGSPLRLAISQLPDAAVISDEMRVIGFNNIGVQVTNPDDYVISRQISTVAGSNYFRFDADSSGTIDQETIDYNLQLGDYQIVGTQPPGADSTDLIFMGIGIDGSQKRTIAHNYSLNIDLKAAQPDAPGSFVFPFTVEEVPSIFPDNGIPTADRRPTFSWAGLIQGDPSGKEYRFQMNRYHNFSGAAIYDVGGLLTPTFTPSASLEADSVYYWRALTSSDDGTTYYDTSHVFAAYIIPDPEDVDGDGVDEDGDGSGTAGDNPCTGGATQNCDDNCPYAYNSEQEDADGNGIGDECDCCGDRVGDANGVGGDEPTIGDVSTMIDALFISGDPDVIVCLAEADVNLSGGIHPGPNDITIGDISTLIDYLFITGPSLGLPDCM